MAKKYSNEEGVWRTIGGRRVFIRTGQSLSDAMRDSGKFKKKDDDEKGKKINETMDKRASVIKKLDDDTKDLSSYDKYNLAVSKLENNDYSSPTERQYWAGEIERYKKSQLSDIAGQRDYNKVDKEWKDLATKMEKDYDEFGTTNWKDEKRLNELSRERDTLQFKEKNSGAYKPQRSFESYYEKMKAHKEGDTWTGKEYTNDEFMEHLTDSNWHSERKALEEAGLTSEELGYIKDRTSLSKWGVGEELTGKDNVQKMINEAKAKGKGSSEIEDFKSDRLKYVQENDKKMLEDYNKAKSMGMSEEKATITSLTKRAKESGNDYLPKTSKIMTAGTSNRKEVSDNIQAHILEHYDNPVDFMEQMDAMDYLPTRWKAGEELASGGSYLIYYDDQREFLNSLNINPKGKTFSDDKVFDMYNSLVGRESERLYNRLEKLYEKYKSEHKGSNVSLDDFRKWFK